LQFTAVRLRDHEGVLHGTILLAKPALPAGIIAETLFQRDPDSLHRMFAMSGAGRRAGAVMFADLESSSALARRLSTASYFSLVRRIVGTTDQCVVDAGGLVGRHVATVWWRSFPSNASDRSRTLRSRASKQLIERLDDTAASALTIEPGRIVHTRLADIHTATDKARRDAPGIAVCQL
jgi:hypothetical protein